MALIRVTATQLRTGADELEALNQQFRNAINQLESQEGTLNGMWDGEANNTFHTAFNNDKIQMTNFYNAIEQYVQKLNEIAARYSQAEAQNAEIAKTRNYQ